MLLVTRSLKLFSAGRREFPAFSCYGLWRLRDWLGGKKLPLKQGGCRGNRAPNGFSTMRILLEHKSSYSNSDISNAPTISKGAHATSSIRGRQGIPVY